jgi:hypothetical protein
LLVDRLPRSKFSGGANNVATVNNECVICFESFEPNVASLSFLSCMHCFHHDCIADWFVSQRIDACPLCKVVVTPQNTTPHNNNNNNNNNNNDDDDDDM